MLLSHVSIHVVLESFLSIAESASIDELPVLAEDVSTTAASGREYVGTQLAVEVPVLSSNNRCHYITFVFLG